MKCLAQGPACGERSAVHGDCSWKEQKEADALPRNENVERPTPQLSAVPRDEVVSY